MTKAIKVAQAIATFVLVGSISCQQLAEAQNDQTDVFDQTYGLSSLTPPTNLAASALSVGSDSITKITSADALITTLGSGIDASGQFKWTGGLEVSPYALGASIDGGKYRQSYTSRLIANSRFSFAFNEGETEDSEGSIAFGLQTLLFNRGDTYLRSFELEAAEYVANVGAAETAIQACARNSINAAMVENAGLGDAAPPPVDGTSERESESDLAPFYENCIREIRASTWNDASLGVGIVAVARADGNEIDDISQSNTIAYLTATYGFDWLDKSDEFVFGKQSGGATPELYSNCGRGFRLSCNAQVVFQLKYQSDGVYEIPDIGEKSGESLGWGAKLVAGSSKSVGYAFYRQENVDVEGQKFDVHEYGIGFEARVFGDQWINLSVSRLDNDLMTEDETVAKASISFSFNDAARLVNPFSSN
tara:strand:+ start:1358 stop:2620 length:1263 start_codon:yes stop_codon:yes gene_type:complete